MILMMEETFSAPVLKRMKQSRFQWKTAYIDSALKRFFDLVAASVFTLLVLSWLIPLIAILIMINSSGPPFFLQWRTGRNGRPFRCLKFRTMYHRPHTGFKQATQNDDRITSVGAYLSRTNLDEMPQFINVLTGDMSGVGPRPHAVEHDDQYWNMPDYQQRYLSRRGITGLSQVRGFRGETQEDYKMKHRLRLDLYYLHHASLGLDIHICWMTFRQMVSGNINAW